MWRLFCNPFRVGATDARWLPGVRCREPPALLFDPFGGEERSPGLGCCRAPFAAGLIVYGGEDDKLSGTWEVWFEFPVSSRTSR